MLGRIVQRISQTAYVRSVMEEPADLSFFDKKPTPRMVWGLVIIGLSYAIGWPVIGLLGILAVSWDEPMLVVVGGPVIYGFSHLAFIWGAWLAGADHVKAFFRWATRATMDKLTKNTKA